ncbi:MAG: LytR/AlgR family response regulator transcription factor [Saprospiraceae bacterium]
MISAIIIDDIQKSRAVLLQLLQRHCPQINVIGMAASADEAQLLILEKNPDLLFLDVEMPNGTGFDLLKRFSSPTFEVIFTTAYDQYALQAIKFCALDYLLKPIDIEELQAAIQKMASKVTTPKSSNRFTHLIENLNNHNHKNHKIGIPTQEGLIFIKVDDILYCTADRSYTYVQLKNQRKIIATRKIKEFENLLTQHDFFRIHRSHLINLNYIEKYYKGAGGYVIMSNGQSIDVSRRKKEGFLEQLDKL